MKYVTPNFNNDEEIVKFGEHTEGSVVNKSKILQYVKELSKAIELAQRAGEVIMKYHNSENIGIETKKDNTPVTLADKASNKLILEGLREAFPLDGIVSEEMEKIE